MTHGVLAEHDRPWGLDAGLTDGGIGGPGTLRHLSQRQVDRLPSEIRRLPETASVAGGESSTATLGAAMEEPQERVDEWCEGLAERGLFLRAHGVTHLPDGGIALDHPLARTASVSTTAMLSSSSCGRASSSCCPSPRHCAGS